MILAKKDTMRCNRVEFTIPGQERGLEVIFGGFRGIDVAICLPNGRWACSINNAVVEIRPCVMFLYKKVCYGVVYLDGGQSCVSRKAQFLLLQYPDSPSSAQERKLT